MHVYEFGRRSSHTSVILQGFSCNTETDLCVGFFMKSEIKPARKKVKREKKSHDSTAQKLQQNQNFVIY